MRRAFARPGLLAALLAAALAIAGLARRIETDGQAPQPVRPWTPDGRTLARTDN
jgi:hypothetical protein